MRAHFVHHAFAALFCTLLSLLPVNTVPAQASTPLQEAPTTLAPPSTQTLDSAQSPAGIEAIEAIDAALPMLQDVKTILAGFSHTCALTHSDQVKCWGSNGTGQLGIGTTGGSRFTPVTVPGLSGVVSLAFGRDHTCALLSNRTVLCWGSNLFGQLGDGSLIDHATPAPVPGLNNAIAIASGETHTCSLANSGSVRCWGENDHGQLGDGTIGTVRKNPTLVAGLGSGVTAITAGEDHTCVALSSGGIKCWGDNTTGQLGNNSTELNHLTPVDVQGWNSPTTYIDAGNGHTCALDTSAGSVKCWGNNFEGTVGDNTRVNRRVATDVVGLGSGVRALASGGSHNCAFLTSGEVQCWGSNATGQLGDGTIKRKLVPTRVRRISSGVTGITAGGGYSCAVIRNDFAQCWGSNGAGKLGHVTGHFIVTPTLAIELPSGIDRITTGSEHTCVRTSSNGAHCWGDNTFGQVGDNTSTPRVSARPVVDLTTTTEMIDIGGEHSCAVTTAGGVKCWGRNNSGQLGIGSIKNKDTPTDVTGLTSGVRMVTVGYNHSCALTNAGGVKCWGSNQIGQLGDGTDINRLTPVNVTGLSSGIIAITAGYNYTCALTSGGAAKCWGSNELGELGNGESGFDKFSFVPVDVLGFSSGATAISSNGGHTCALVNGGVKCWGDNIFGQLGDGTTTSRTQAVNVSGLGSGVTAIATGDRSSCAIDNQRMKCWGDNQYGQLGDGTLINRLTPVSVIILPRDVQAIASKYRHSCGLSTSNGLYCWGDNTNGQIGDGLPTSKMVYPAFVIDPSATLSAADLMKQQAEIEAHHQQSQQDQTTDDGDNDEEDVESEGATIYLPIVSTK